MTLTGYSLGVPYSGFNVLSLEDYPERGRSNQLCTRRSGGRTRPCDSCRDHLIVSHPMNETNVGVNCSLSNGIRSYSYLLNDKACIPQRVGT